MTLNELTDGKSGIICKVRGRGAFRKRLIEMGFIRGAKVTAVRNAPLNDPVEYRIMDYNVSLRRSEAALIELRVDDEPSEHSVKTTEATILTQDSIPDLQKSPNGKTGTIDIVLVGNPNCGKTTLFNFMAGMHERVGNYSGVTVESKIAHFHYKGYKINLVDLPGAYSITAYSPEEIYIRNYILEHQPDIILNVVDASNLERNLYLTTQLIDMDQRVLVALNMYDELEARGDVLDIETLSTLLGTPMVPTVGNKRKGINELLDKAIALFEDQLPQARHIHINYGHDFEPAIQQLQKLIKPHSAFTDRISSRFAAIKLLEKDKEIEEKIKSLPTAGEIQQTQQKLIDELEKHLADDTESLIAEIRYGFIAGAIKETCQQDKKNIKKTTPTQKIDSILTHKIWSFPIFLFFLFVTFQATFTLGSYPKGWIELGVAAFRDFLGTLLPESFFRDLLLDGVIDGVGGVIVFLPNILILFFFISIMEDTGYMARIAFIMDKLMHKIGLHGKSFIPMIMGFGCNVPAIMATRTLENRNDRLLTMLINPFMSCSARLPVYILLIGTFFPDYSFFILFLIYMIGVLFAVFFSILFKKTIFRSKDAPFVMELPPYRVPTLRATFSHIWFRASLYLKKMGGTILIASLIIWFLGYFPRNVNYSKDYDNEIKHTQAYYQQLIAQPSTDEKQKNQYLYELDSIVSKLQIAKESERLEKSFIGMFGKAIEPAISPLGFDWKIGVSLITGIPAKEIVISTLGVLYQVEDDNSVSLGEKLKSEQRTSFNGNKENVFNPYVAFALIMFTLLYSPCIATVTAIRKESGSWKWALFVVVYTTLLAWIIAFLTVKIGPLIFG